MSHHGAVVVSIIAGLVLMTAGTARAQTPPNPTRAPSLAQTPPSTEPAPSPSSKPESKPAAPTDGSHKPSATEAIVIGLNTLEGVVSKSVRSATGNEDMGRIVDVLVDGAGQTRAAVIDFGGFLGVGSRKVAVDWNALDFTDSIKSGTVKVSLSRDQVRQSPEYKVGEPVVVLEGSKPAPAAPPQNRPDAATAH
jgi:hypothetical protein